LASGTPTESNQARQPLDVMLGAAALEGAGMELARIVHAPA